MSLRKLYRVRVHRRWCGNIALPGLNKSAGSDPIGQASLNNTPGCLAPAALQGLTRFIARFIG